MSPGTIHDTSRIRSIDVRIQQLALGLPDTQNEDHPRRPVPKNHEGGRSDLAQVLGESGCGPRQTTRGQGGEVFLC